MGSKVQGWGQAYKLGARVVVSGKACKAAGLLLEGAV